MALPLARAAVLRMSIVPALARTYVARSNWAIHAVGIVNAKLQALEAATELGGARAEAVEYVRAVSCAARLDNLQNM